MQRIVFQNQTWRIRYLFLGWTTTELCLWVFERKRGGGIVFWWHQVYFCVLCFSVNFIFTVNVHVAILIRFRLGSFWGRAWVIASAAFHLGKCRNTNTSLPGPFILQQHFALVSWLRHLKSALDFHFVKLQVARKVVSFNDYFRQAVRALMVRKGLGSSFVTLFLN